MLIKNLDPYTLLVSSRGWSLIRDNSHVILLVFKIKNLDPLVVIFLKSSLFTWGFSSSDIHHHFLLKSFGIHFFLENFVDFICLFVRFVIFLKGFGPLFQIKVFFVVVILKPQIIPAQYLHYHIPLISSNKVHFEELN